MIVQITWKEQMLVACHLSQVVTPETMASGSASHKQCLTCKYQDRGVENGDGEVFLMKTASSVFSLTESLGMTSGTVNVLTHAHCPLGYPRFLCGKSITWA